MNSLSWFKKRFRDGGKHYINERIPPERVRYSNDQTAKTIDLVAGQHYFRLWLPEMFLKNDRNWFSNWHPAVHSAVTFDFGNKNKVVTKIAGPSMLSELDKKHLDRVIQSNHKLTPLMPFNGGTVGLSCGLLAMQGKNDVSSFIKVLGDFSGLLMVPQLSAAIEVAAPLAEGVAQLIDSTDGELMVGLEETFSSAGGDAEAVLRSGYTACILAQEGKDLDTKKLWVKEDELHYGNSIDESEHLTGWNYILLRIEAREERDDWDSLDAIQKPYDKAITLLQLHQVDQAQALLREAIAAALISPDLTRQSDRRRVVDLLKKKFEEAKVDFGAGAFAGADRSLASLMSGSMSVEEAMSKPVITEAEAIAGLYE